ncbi:MAG: hypothetical protein ACRD33_00180 [Candidatus Acidiferrales bacterium]
MSKISIPGALLIAFVLVIALVYGAPMAVASYQTHEATVEVSAAQSTYSTAIADARAQRQADEKAVLDRYTRAIESAQESRQETLTQIRAEYPHARIAKPVAIKDTSE